MFGGPVGSRGSRFCDTSSTRTPSLKATRTTSAPENGMSVKLGDNETAADANRPIPKPVRNIFAGSKSYFSGEFS